MARDPRKAPKNRKSLRRAQYCEIKRDVTCIPAGVYRLEEFTDGCAYSFRLGEVYFTVFTRSQSLVERLPQGSGRERATTKEHFLKRYYELVSEESAESRGRRGGPVASDAVTMVVLPVSAERCKLLQQGGTRSIHEPVGGAK